MVVPVHNGAALLGDAVRSALMQEGVQLEVIVVDDGSDDDPASALPSDPRVSLMSTSHMGVSQARNSGFRAGRGRMVVFLDADDAMTDPFRVRDQLALLDQRPELAIVHSGWEVIDSDGRSVTTRTPWIRLPDLSLEHWVGYPVVLPSAMAFRRTSVVACGGFDVGLRQMEDVDLVFRLLLRGWRAAWLERVTTQYRRHGASASQDIDAQAHAHSVVLHRLFSDPDLPTSVASQERMVRY